MNQELKSAEQKMIEQATTTYAAKLKSFLGDDVKVAVVISGARLDKMGAIAEHLRDYEGDVIKIRLCEPDYSPPYNYIHRPIKGDGWEIEEISTQK